MCELCHEQHNEIKHRLDTHARDLEMHISETHELLMSKADILASDDKLETEIELLAAALLGPKRSEFYGGGRDERAGMAFQVQKNFERIGKLESQASNGGFRAKLSKTQATAIYVAGIGAVATVVAALVN